MAKEYIEREALLKRLKYKRDNDTDYSRKKYPGLESAIAQVIKAPRVDVVEVPQAGVGELSDGYHTFNELYHHRAVLFSVICNLFPERAWKSKLHDTGDMFDGMFIVGIETPDGQATYHYDIAPYWKMFKVRELERAPKWDGHTPQGAIERIAKFGGMISLLFANMEEIIDATE